MDRCPSCGTELPIIGGGAFCMNCGAMVRAGSSDLSADETVTLPRIPGPQIPSPQIQNPQPMTRIMPVVAPAPHVSELPPQGYGQPVGYTDPNATGGYYYPEPYQDGYDGAGYDVSPPPSRVNRSSLIAVGVAAVAVAVIAVSVINLDGGKQPSASQVPLGPTEVVTPPPTTSLDASTQSADGDPTAPPSTSATPTPSTTSTASHAGPVTGLGSGRCIDIPGAHAVDGIQVELFSCNATAAQSWTYTNGTVQAMGKCLDVRGADSRDRTPVQLFTCNGTAAQQWTYDPQTGELKTLGKCLDASGAGTADHTPLILYTCHSAENQKWHLAQ